MVGTKRSDKEEDGFAGILALLFLLIVVLASFAVLVLLGALVFAASLPLGIILALGLLLSWFGPGWIKILGGLMVLGSILAALLMIVM
jgi:hypothetical protein